MMVVGNFVVCWRRDLKVNADKENSDGVSWLGGIGV